ncbi:flagellar FlbD family protein [Caproiciproducens sp. LBM24188]|jgi:flagellar protein FlbD|nr:endoflagellar protein [Oscillospiraceae bacterium]HHV31928.1 flagellar FlbD family protein [Clostridiales bacterium]
MIELTNLNGVSFVLNSNLIEDIVNIPETKVTLTTGKYYLVSEDKNEIIKKVIAYNREIFKNVIRLKD